MRSSMRKSILSAAALAFCLLSCARDAPSLSEVQAVPVLEYEGGTSTQLRLRAASHLAVFVCPETPIEQTAEIKLENGEAGLEWTCRDPVGFTDADGRAWTGYARFAPVRGESIPQGEYTLTYEDASGQTCESSFNVEFPRRLIFARPEAFPRIIASPDDEDAPSYETKLALYSAEGALLWYGDAPEDERDRAELAKDRGAASARVCYVTSSPRVIYAMPPEDFAGDERQGAL